MFGGFYVVSPKSVFGVSSLVLQDKFMGNCCRNPSAKHKMKNTFLGVYFCVSDYLFDSVGYLAHDKVNETSISICD
jgi:hypothetical protein